MQINIDQEVSEFILSLEKQAIAKTLRTLDLLERFGHLLSLPHSKKVSVGLFELRVRGQQEIRILYCFYKGSTYLLNGFIKKSQKTPQKELTKGKRKLKALTGYNL